MHSSMGLNNVGLPRDPSPAYSEFIWCGGSSSGDDNYNENYVPGDVGNNHSSYYEYNNGPNIHQSGGQYMNLTNSAGITGLGTPRPDACVDVEDCCPSGTTAGLAADYYGPSSSP